MVHILKSSVKSILEDGRNPSGRGERFHSMGIVRLSLGKRSKHGSFDKWREFVMPEMGVDGG